MKFFEEDIPSRIIDEGFIYDPFKVEDNIFKVITHIIRKLKLDNAIQAPASAPQLASGQDPAPENNPEN